MAEKGNPFSNATPAQKAEPEPATGRAAPEPVASQKTADPEPAVTQRTAPPEAVVTQKTIEPEPAVTQRTAPPEAVITQKTVEPEPAVTQRTAPPEAVITQKTVEPEPAVIQRTAPPEAVVTQKTVEPEPAVTQRTAPPEAVITQKTVEPEPAVIPRAAPPEPVVTQRAAPPEAVVTQKTAEPEPVVPVSVAAGVQASVRDDGLPQPTTESDNGKAADTPNAVNDNPNPGTESSDSLTDFQRPGNEFSDVDLGAAADVAAAPRDRAEERGIAANTGTAEGGGGGGGAPEGAEGGGTGTNRGTVWSVEEDLAAASGDRGPAADLTSSDPLAAAIGARSGGESLTDLQMASGSAAIEAAGATSSGPSVADGGALAAAIAAADEEAAKRDSSPDLTKFKKIGDGLTAEELAEEEEPGLLDQFLDWVDGDFKMDASSGTLPSRDFTGIEGFTPVGTITQVEGANAEGVKVSNFETAIGKAMGSKKGGVKDPGPDGEAPLTPEEIAFRQALNAELGIGRIPGDVDPVDGDGTNTGRASEGNLGSAEEILNSGATGLVGNPGTPGGNQPSGGSGSGSVTPGPDGREILLENGSNVDDARTEDMPDFNVGSDPLVGFPSQEEEEEEADTTSPVFSMDPRHGRGADEE